MVEYDCTLSRGMATSVLVMRSVCLEQAVSAVRMVVNSLLLGSSRRIAEGLPLTWTSLMGTVHLLLQRR